MPKRKRKIISDTRGKVNIYNFSNLFYHLQVGYSIIQCLFYFFLIKTIKVLKYKIKICLYCILLNNG